MQNTTRMFALQQQLAFAPSKTLGELLTLIPQQRCLPGEGVNLSTLFGEAVLGQLGLSEEQADWTQLLRAFPQADLRAAAQSHAPLRELHARLQARARADAELSVYMQTGLRQAEAELRTVAAARTLLQLASAEKSAAEIPQAFLSHCAALQHGLSSIDASQKVLIFQLIEFVAAFDAQLPLLRLSERFFDLVLECETKVETMHTFTALIESFASKNSWHESKKNEAMVTTPLEPCLKASSIFDESGDTDALAPLYARLTANSLPLKQQYPLKIGFAAGAPSAYELLRQAMEPELFCDYTHLSSDLLALVYLFDLDHPQKLVIPKALYYRLTEAAGSQLIGTLPQLLLQPMLSTLCDALCSLLHSFTLAILFIVKFGKPENTQQYSGVLLQCVRHFFTLTRLCELLGIQRTELFSNYRLLLDSIVPNFAGQPETGLDAQLRLDAVSTGYEELWSYEYSSKPWMPPSYLSLRRPSRSVFNLIKADRVLNMLPHSDSRLCERWCGQHEESSISAVLRSAMLEESLQHPEKLVSRKFLLSQLHNTTEGRTTFYDSTAHQRYCSAVTCEETLDAATDWDTGEIGE